MSRVVLGCERRPVCAALAVALLFAVASLSCETTKPASGSAPGSATESLSRPLRVEPNGTPVPEGWRRLTTDSARWVSPKWGPSGKWVRVRGWGGIGLALVSTRTGEVRFRDSGFRGRVRFLEPGLLCRGGVEAGTLVRYDARAGRWQADSTPCTTREWDERLGTRVMAGTTLAVYHHAYAGTITQVDRHGTEIPVEDRGAWAVAATADGRRVAWSLGTVRDSRLFIYDPDQGRVALGAGTYPAWLPDGRRLIFARLQPDVKAAGPRSGYRSDLYLYDVQKKTLVQLTDTAHIAEMEPAVSPDGATVAFTDWNTGVAYLAPIPGPNAARSPRKGGRP